MTPRTPEEIARSKFRIIDDDSDEGREISALADAICVMLREKPGTCIIDRDADGKAVVRKVLGTLPLTADGCVAGNGAEISFWSPGYQAPWTEIVFMTGAMGDDVEVNKCYSTREAAERAAKEPRP